MRGAHEGLVGRLGTACYVTTDHCSHPDQREGRNVEPEIRYQPSRGRDGLRIILITTGPGPQGPKVCGLFAGGGEIRTLGPGLNGDWVPRSIGSHDRWMPSVCPGRALAFPSDLKRCRLGEVAAGELHQ